MTADVVERRLRALEYFQGAALPDLAGEFVELNLDTEEGRAEAGRRAALRIQPQPEGHGNRLFLHREATPFPDGFAIHLHGDRNTVVIDRGFRMLGGCFLVRDDNLAVFLQNAAGRVHCTAEAGSVTIWGRDAFAWDTRMAAQGGSVITIGDRGLMALGVLILATDFHSLVDAESLIQINFPADVHIGSDVWLGERCTVLKGVRIGKGSVLSAGAVATKSIPARQAWAGNPALCVRKNVSWVRSHPATPEDLEALRGRLAEDQ